MTSPYDNKDCTGWDLSDRTDMDGLTIEGLCLSNETPNAQVLPLNLTGTTFVWCNLDNVYVPPGNTIGEGCSNRLFQVQADGQDWLLAASSGNGSSSSGSGLSMNLHTSMALQVTPTITLVPIQPLNLANAVANGFNIDPNLIQSDS